MPTESDSTQAPRPQRATWIVVAAVVATGTAAVFSYSLNEEAEAAPGAQLYNSAVKEALHGLANPGARRRPAAGGRPQLPAGLDPKQHYWCENCKAWHKKGDAAAPQSPAAAPATPRVAIPYRLGMAPGDPQPGSRPASQPAAGTTPPLPEGLDPADYYWCGDCRAYHKKNAAAPQGHGAASTPPPRRAVVPFRPGMAPGDAPPSATKPPPLPGNLNPADYYWCDKCRAYHRRNAPEPPAHRR